MLASLTVISRASSGWLRTKAAMELRVLKRNGDDLALECVEAGFEQEAFCSSSLSSMRRAFQTLSAIPTTMTAQSQTSTCRPEIVVSSAKSLCG